MTQFEMEHDSERQIYNFRKNGKVLGGSSKIAAMSSKPLEEILQVSSNWKGLFEEIARTCNDDEVELQFTGKQKDFDDLAVCVHLYRGGTKFYLHFLETKKKDNVHDETQIKIYQKKIIKKEKQVKKKTTNQLKDIKAEKQKEKMKGVTEMTKFSIEYNPYTVQTVFKKNDKELSARSKMGAKTDVRLQVLLSPMGNWKGLAEEIVTACNDNDIDLHFKGRRIDYEDLKYCVESYKGKVRFNLTFTETRNDNDIIKELDGLFAEIKKSDLPEFKGTNKAGKNIFDAYQDVKNGVFEVSVIATMSSGKSTLINSLLHTELLPSENKACTASIVEILDNDQIDGYEAECYADKERTQLVHGREKVTLEKMKEYNGIAKYIDVEGNIPAVSSNKIRLCLRDTPGPNNSNDPEHEALTNSVIEKENAVILYVMNATQSGINDDRELLKSIAKEMRRRGKQSHDRFIFVVNKCDALDEEKGETVEQKLEEARAYLKKFGITDPILIPTTARLALLVRKSRNGESLSRVEKGLLTQIEDYVKVPLLHFEKYATLTPGVTDKLEKQAAEYHKNEDDWDLEAVIHTGVSAVEETIREYIDKYAYPIKIKDAIQDISQILGELDMTAKFRTALAADNGKLEKVRKQIEEAKKKHADSKGIYDEYARKIERFSLEPDLQKQERKYATNLEESISKKYYAKGVVDKLIADKMISDFIMELEELQKNCEKHLNCIIDEHIYKKGMEMLDEYSMTVAMVLKNIEIEEYDFGKVTSFEKIKINNINDIERGYEQKRYRDEIRWKDNPDRAGFMGFFKFWKPKKVSYTVQLHEGIDVDLSQIVINIMGEFADQLYRNIDKIFDEAEDKIKEYKDTFKDNMGNLNEEINNILDKLEFDTREKEQLEKNVQENKKRYDWISKKEAELKNILRF